MRSESYTTKKGTPEFLAALEIRTLIKMTASVLGGEIQSLKGKDSRQLLALYQEYTKQSLLDRSGEELTVFRDKMYQKAFALGRRLGRLPGCRSDQGKSRLIRRLYANIDIVIVGDMPGEICIPHCSFSRIYTPQMCFVMAGMDAGIICGIFGGGTFEFSRRLTEGCRDCRATYRRDGNG